MLMQERTGPYGATRDRIGGSNNVQSQVEVEWRGVDAVSFIDLEHGSFPMEQILVDRALFLKENLLIEKARAEGAVVFGQVWKRRQPSCHGGLAKVNLVSWRPSTYQQS